MSKTPFRRRGAAIIAGALPAAALAHPARAEHTPPPPATPLADTILVTARPAAATTDTLSAPRPIALPADAATIAARAPGGAAAINGPLSGQLSYRGLAGERVAGRINGQSFATGGPNAMDPPLHYAPAVLVESLTIVRGVAPVADGPALAGAVDARLLHARFTDSSEAGAHGAAAIHARSANSSFAVGGLAGLATNRWRLGVIASREEGEDYRFPGGRAGDTAYRRALMGVEGGFRAGPGEAFIEYRRSETDPSGNPPYALDIVYFDTDFLQAGFGGEIAPAARLDLRMGHVAVRHLMDDITVRRPVATPASARATYADADSFTAEARLRLGTPARHLLVGADAQWADRFVRITHPANAAFFIDSQPDMNGRRAGAFVQARTALGGWAVEAGLRLDRTRQSAGLPQLGAAVPAMPRMLAAAYAASARAAEDTIWDAVLKLWAEDAAFAPRLTLARKTRVPSVLERFAWLPTEASYGLADGNIYLGNQALRPETAWIAEAGFDWTTRALTLRPTAFYRRVEDYIQGTPYDGTPGVLDSASERVAAMSGDATPLMFRNVSAELYGLDLDFTARPLGVLVVEGTASFVRGKRRDIDDDLYRVAPANLRVAAAREGPRWVVGAELLAAAAQNNVSATNGESVSEGYAVLGLFGQLWLTRGLELAGGIENLTNRLYRPHLAGRNRVPGSDVAVGERLPGAARGGWVRLTAAF